MQNITAVSRRQFLNTLPAAAVVATTVPQMALAATSNLLSPSVAFQLGEHLGLQARAILGRPARASLLQFEFAGFAAADSLRQGLLSSLNLSGPEMAARSGGAFQWHGPVDSQAAAVGYAVVGVEGTSQTAVIELSGQALSAMYQGVSVQSLQACGECRVVVA